ncbi:histidine kinase [Flavobacterium sp. Sd200]|uniref:sensor histidine kinase n=1 Tax=Flavobacterium sp. Sd200 TaxID=2692211 RepID=UPI00136FEF1E|nr:histidine kinase [Flavobacterium sp. Sd200]MXN92428.1 histidine kinase [Flavobacterium sp. Sd200]
MKNYLRYENIWFRNLFIVGFIYGAILLVNYFEGPDDERILRLTYSMFSFYAAIIVSNLLFIKGMLQTNHYKRFVIFFSLYWLLMIVIAYHFDFSRNPEITPFTRGLKQFLSAFVGSGFYFIHLWITQNVISTNRQLAMTQTELDFLKQQLNPHFLLNAMNNLYGESLSHPEDMPERILQLSELLRYQIEAAKTTTVSLKSEMDFVKKYLDYSIYKNAKLVVTNNSNIPLNTKLSVPPLLFMPLVENAVKFSMETPQPFIAIDWEMDDDCLVFAIQNSCLPQGSKSFGTGLGLANLKRRLDLLSLDYDCTYTKTGSIYNYKLKLCKLHTAA